MGRNSTSRVRLVATRWQVARLAAVLGAIVAMASLAGCSDDSDSSPSPTQSPAGTSTGTPEPPPTSTPSPETQIPTYGLEARTGISLLDQILVSVLAANIDDIQSRLGYVEVACVTSGDSIRAPECPDSVAAGTMVPAFLLTGCESTYERKDAIGPVVQGFVTAGLQLFAVYRVDPAKAGNLAPGDFGLVFVDTRQTPGQSGATMVAVTADSDGRIVRWATSCSTTTPAEFMAERPVLNFILPPR